MNFVSEPSKQIACLAEYDVIVCGGGIAGISAALASARQGAKTMLIEREYMLGGLATAGLIAIYLPICDGCGRQVSFGIAEELLKLSIKEGSEARHLPECWKNEASIEERSKHRYTIQYDPSVFAILAEKLLLKEGVNILYGTTVCSTLMNDQKISHLLVENKSGRQAFKAKSVVDATGDADIVHLSGEDEALFGQGNVLAGWFYEFINGKKHLRLVGASDVPDEDKDKESCELLTKRRFTGLDAAEITEQVIMGHSVTLEHFLKNGGVSDDHSIATISSIPQVRMTRRVKGIVCIDTKDEHKEYSDSVGLFSNWKKNGPVYELPFSTLYGAKVKNLLCAGRNISATDAMWDVTRVIPVCAVSGEAAGVAAAMSDDFSKIDYNLLAKKLRENGVILHERDL